MRDRPREADLTLALGVMDAFLTWAKEHKEPRTFEWYQRHLRAFARSIPSLLPVGQLKKHHLTSCCRGQAQAAGELVGPEVEVRNLREVGPEGEHLGVEIVRRREDRGDPLHALDRVAGPLRALHLGVEDDDLLRGALRGGPAPAFHQRHVRQPAAPESMGELGRPGQREGGGGDDDPADVEQLRTHAVILLMFGVGLHFRVEELRRLRGQGRAAVYGDATHRDTLVGAGVGQAGSRVLSSSGMKGSEEVICLARELNPAARILARAAYVRELHVLQRAGAEVVLSGEGEVALALTKAILLRLGATPEQVDRGRERVRADLVAGYEGAYSRDADGSPAQLLPPSRGGRVGWAGVNP